MTNSTTFPGSVSCATSNTSNAMTLGTTKTFVVTVSDASGYNKYYIDGYLQPVLELHQGQTYIFDLSSSTLSGHPFVFDSSNSNDGTTNSDPYYTTGITTTGTYGSSEKRTFVVPVGSPTTLYYYCTIHSGMGASMSISPTAEFIVSGPIESKGFVVTGTGGASLGGGTTAQRPSNPKTGTIRYNSTTGFMESYTASGWKSITQPPTVTGISPLTTLTSGGQVAVFGGGAKFTVTNTDANLGPHDNVGKYSVITGDGTKFVTSSVENYYSTGAVYTYTYSGGSWGSPVKTQGSDTVNYDAFASSLAMNRSGTKLLVGQKGNGSTTGYAYLYTYSGGSWGSEVKFSPPSSASVGDYFGTNVAMNDDGTKIIVAAPKDDDKGTDAGAAYIFTYSSGSWDTGTKIVAADGQAGYQFGAPGANIGPNHMAMSGDGTTVVVGSYKWNTAAGARGAAYVFTYSSGSWDSGTKVVRGDAADWDSFGYSVAMNADGTQMLVGATGKSNGTVTSGAVYHYIYSSGSWSEQQKIISSDGEATDKFGEAISINYDWTKLIVGAKLEDTPSVGSDTGAAYTFTYNGSTWSQDAKLLAAVSDSSQSDSFGSSVTSSADGSRVVIGAPFEDTNGTNAGAVYIFDLDLTTEILDTATQVFTATGAGITPGSTVQLEGADGTLYSVFDTTPNAAGTQVTFKMGALGATGGYVVANQPYKIRINAKSGLITTSTAMIGFAVGWTSPAAGATLTFDTNTSTTHTLAGTGGAGGINRTFSVAPLSASLPAGLTLTGSTGVITGTIAATGTTSVTFRLTDNASGLFADRASNIVGADQLYTFNSHTFTRGNQTGAQLTGGQSQGDPGGFTKGPTFAQMKSAYASEIWELDTAWFNEISGKQGMQLWTVPKSGTYRMTVRGARGGLCSDGSPNPGEGAVLVADFVFAKNLKLVIIVGQTGRTPNSRADADLASGTGGGGASWVFKYRASPFATYTNDLYMVAGGGGGAHNSSPAGGNAYGTSQGSIGGGGAGGTGSCGGGAGWTGDGTGSGAYGDHTGGFSPANGAKGGLPSEFSAYASEGGFGGGGGNGFGTTGGGGGGATGGRGSNSSYTAGLGGTSYIMPNGTGGVTVSNRTFSGNHGAANGSVTIQVLT